MGSPLLYKVKTIRHGRFKTFALLAWLAAMLTGCNSETYDTGDGAYSLLRADFGVATIDARKAFTDFLSDDGTQVHLLSPATPAWALVADTAYRVLCYYNVADATGNNQKGDYVTSTQVPVLEPYSSVFFEDMKTDPVVFESMWMSANGKYLNLGFSIKTGQADGADQVQTIALVDHGTTENADGTQCRQWQFFHDQGGVPEYYSSRKYASIPMDGVQEDSVCVTINSYGGTVSRTFAVTLFNH